MPIFAENTRFNQFRVIKKLAETILWEDYLVEQLFLGSTQRLRLITSDIINIPNCYKTIERNLKDFSRLYHPYLISFLIYGRYEKYLFYTFQHYEGVSLKDFFSQQKLNSEEFCKFHSQFLEIFNYLQQESVSCENLALADFVLAEDYPLLINFNLFSGVEEFIPPSKQPEIYNFLAVMGGAYFARQALNAKENLINIARLMYQSVGWGDLNEAIKVKQGEEMAQKKKRQKSYVPLVPGLDQRIENIILRAVVDKSRGGFGSLRELTDELQNLKPRAKEEKSAFISAEMPQEEEKFMEPIKIPPIESGEGKKSVVPSITGVSTFPGISLPLARRRGKKLPIKKILRLFTITALLVIFISVSIYVGRQFLVKKNTLPIANATTPANFISVNSKIILDGSSSFDPDKDALYYYWEVVSGEAKAVSFSVNRSSQAAKTQATFSKKGTYKITLRVFDGTAFSEPALIIISVY